MFYAIAKYIYLCSLLVVNFHRVTRPSFIQNLKMLLNLETMCLYNHFLKWPLLQPVTNLSLELAHCTQLIRLKKTKAR